MRIRYAHLLERSMRLLKCVCGLAVLLVASSAVPAALGQTMAGPYAGPYTLVDLGAVPGVPTNYGGLCFLNNNALLIGGNANTASGRIYSVGVTRNGSNQITGFTGPA